MEDRRRGAGAATALSPFEEHVFSVSELVGEVRALLSEAAGRVWVCGEISNLRRPTSGHQYFTLKDDAAQLRAVLFRGRAARIPFELEDGLEVVVSGELTVYEARGDLQILVETLEPRGRGALQLAFEQLRARLEKEGLFAPERKRPLPEFPRAVGVVTSPRSAAVRDVIRVARERFPATPLVVAPAPVQGEGADLEIIAALERLVRHGRVDVVLLVRGGGSLEDLWAFNSDALARAIVACPVPVVSGVGHEIDVTIADLAADARAATPSAAAAMVLPDRDAVREWLARDARRLQRAMRHLLERLRARLAAARDGLRRLAPRARLRAQRERLHALALRLERATRGGLERRRARVAALAGRLDSLSPLAVLARGYAIVRRADDHRVVRRPADVAPGDALHILLAEGALAAEARGPVDPEDGESG